MKYTRLLLLAVCLAFAQQGQAQPGKLRHLPKAVRASHVQHSLLERKISSTLSRRPDIRLSVARLDHACLLDCPMNKRPHSTAFLFTTRDNGNWYTYAVTAGHTAQLGEELLLTFYNGKKEIPIRGTVVQQGPALLSDIALIKIDSPFTRELNPLKLTTQVNPQEKLTTWGYSANKLYQINNLTLEKDNTRFLRTDFPAAQTKRSGLCGGPLLNVNGEVLGVHCGSTWEDKSYAASVRMIPYLLQAYHNGHAEIPIIAKEINFGSIDINERIIYVQCMNEQGQLINQEDIYDQLPQSLLMSLYQDPEVRYLRFVLGSYQKDFPTYRVLVYDKTTATSYFEPLRQQQNIYK